MLCSYYLQEIAELSRNAVFNMFLLFFAVLNGGADE